MPMKRLKHKLLSMQPNTATYHEMYDGSMRVSDPQRPAVLPWEEYDPTYYSEGLGFRITATHKLAQDKPTVTILLPCELLGIRRCSAAVADLCLREFAPYIDELNAQLYNRSRPDTGTGKYYLCRPGGEILERNAACFALCPQKDYENGSGSKVYLLADCSSLPPQMCLCIKLQVQLPQKKLRKTIQMLCRDLPDAAKRFVAGFDPEKLQRTEALAEKQATIRAWLKTSDYCAFIANGSILPRAKGTDLPLEDAVPFQSVPDDEIEVCGVRGMGFRRGVTLITGGGYSGKSTLLDAISAGIYDHISGDGRELCITDESAVTISAEDGRSVRHLNISPFIQWLPGGDARDFSTEHASGSTSQASNIMEALDGGSRLLLIDEDRSAANFMIRDPMMKELISKEPITPFTDRVNELAALGVSTILVIGGSGEYLPTADRIYGMEDYQIHDVTERAKAICSTYRTTAPLPPAAQWEQHRTLLAERFTSYPEGCGSERLEVMQAGFLIIGDERIDLRGLRNIISPRQQNALAFMLRHLMISNPDEEEIDLPRRIDELYARIANEGLDFLYSSYFTTCERFLDLPRRQELLALIHRMRKIRLKKADIS